MCALLQPMRKGVAITLLMGLAGCGGGSGDASLGPPALQNSGLDTRPSNTTCLAGEEPSVALATQTVFAGRKTWAVFLLLPRPF